MTQFILTIIIFHLTYFTLTIIFNYLMKNKIKNKIKNEELSNFQLGKKMFEYRVRNTDMVHLVLGEKEIEVLYYAFNKPNDETNLFDYWS